MNSNSGRGKEWAVRGRERRTSPFVRSCECLPKYRCMGVVKHKMPIYNGKRIQIGSKFDIHMLCCFSVYLLLAVPRKPTHKGCKL